MTDFQTLIVNIRSDIQRLANRFGLDRDELVSEAWLTLADHPGMSRSALVKKLLSSAIQHSRINGVTQERAVGDDQIDFCTSTQSVLDELIERERLMERDNRIDRLDSRTKARVEMLEGCGSASRLSDRFGVKECMARRKVQIWIDEASRPQAQASLF